MKTNRASLIKTLTFFATILFVIAGTYLVVRFAKGDRLGSTGQVKGTGLLAANSFPTSAEVYINGRLTTATDNTLNLDPNTYQIEIKKDGYHTWSKNLQIEAELVTSTNAQLFPTSPSLEPLTYIGAINTIPSPDGSHLAYTVASSSASSKNGLYIQDLTSSVVNLNRNARQIAQSTAEYDFTKSTYAFSPNSSEILVSFESGAHLLLDTSRSNDIAELKDVTWKISTILSDWEIEIARAERVRLLELPLFFQEIATGSSTIGNLYFSPDGEKLLYQALSNLEIPNDLIPSLPASSTQPESRTLEPGSWYVYDLKEDKNFLISQGPVPSPSPSPTLKAKTRNQNLEKQVLQPKSISKLMLLSDLSPIPAETVSSPSAFKQLQDNHSIKDSLLLLEAQYSSIFVHGIQWYSDSSHLILHTDKGIDIIEYDGTNRVAIYAGPFDSNIVYPWPDGSKIVTRIQFSESAIPNLYTIKLK